MLATTDGSGAVPEVVTRYLAAVDTVLGLLGTEAITAGWESPSVLAGMTVGALAGHTARSAFQVEEFLGQDDPRSPAPVGASAYYAAVAGLDDPESQVNAGVRLRGATLARLGPHRLLADVRSCRDRLAELLPALPADRQVLAFAGQPMLLGDYLRTRVIELTVHGDDLALSVGAPLPGFAAEALADAVDVLVGTARIRHGERAVLTALSRRERDTVAALRVL